MEPSRGAISGYPTMEYPRSPSSLLRLPNELLEQVIAGCVDYDASPINLRIESLAAVRLVCRRLANVATSVLFYRMEFEAERSLKRFMRRVGTTPEFSTLVKEFVSFIPQRCWCPTTRFVSRLELCIQLKTLTLRDSHLVDILYQLPRSAGHFPVLESCKLSCSGIAMRFAPDCVYVVKVEWLLSLFTSPRLKRFTLTHVKVEASTPCTTLTGRLPAIKKLSFLECEFGDDALKYFRALRPIDTLQIDTPTFLGYIDEGVAFLEAHEPSDLVDLSWLSNVRKFEVSHHVLRREWLDIHTGFASIPHVRRGLPNLPPGMETLKVSISTGLIGVLNFYETLRHLVENKEHMCPDLRHLIFERTMCSCDPLSYLEAEWDEGEMSVCSETDREELLLESCKRSGVALWLADPCCCELARTERRD